ncbi:MAG: Rrf2 family transcriptional regulator [Gammaproteobacteria bacterium]|jgi:Rrf2 family protein
MTLSNNVHHTLIAATILASKQGRIGAVSTAPSTSLTELHEALGLSVPYLQQLFKCLRDAGLVMARCGPKGGYRLTRRASKITLGSVARAVETNGVGGVGGEPEEVCDRLNSCFDTFLDTTTLGDMASTRVAERRGFGKR